MYIYLFKALQITFLLFILYCVLCTSSRVVELSDRFLELRGDSAWLIMFYAPWCGHCRKLEPTWMHVAQGLYGTNVRVGKVDATRFTSLASEFDVKGYPTIIFVRGNERHTYSGDRTTASIVGFSRRLIGPVVPHMDQLPDLMYMPTAREGTDKEESAIFVYVGIRNGDLWDSFVILANQYRYFHYFYSMDNDGGKRLTGTDFTSPTVLVHKDKTNLVYPGPTSLDSLNVSLSRWINHERFPHFVKLTSGNINQVFKMEKYIVMVVVEETKTGLLTSDEDTEHYVDAYKFRDMVQTVAREHRSRYHEWIQFGWTGSPYLANSFAMSRLPLPSVLMINTSTLVHHLPAVEPHLLTHVLLEEFLDGVLNGTDSGYGGDSYVMRVRRALFSARTSLEDMWQGNPVLTALLFGLPLGFLSLILYSVCCGDILDASEEEEDEEYEQHYSDDNQHEKND